MMNVNLSTVKLPRLSGIRLMIIKMLLKVYGIPSKKAKIVYYNFKPIRMSYLQKFEKIRWQLKMRY